MPRNLITSLAVLLILSKPCTLKAQSKFIQEVQKASIDFTATLSSLQKRVAIRPFDDTARVMWNNLPVGLRARAGISIGAMSDDQRRLLHRLLSVSLSSQGYLKATSIMHLDNLLNAYYDSLYARKIIDERLLKQLYDLQWSHRNFYLAFFGQPGDPIWGYKLEGHHLSINFTVRGNELAVTPLFVGTDPAEYMMGEYAGWRPLGQEEDLGLKLVNSLSPAQLKKAVISNNVPGDIITSAESGRRLLDYQGIKAADLNTEQQALLTRIVKEFVFNLEEEKAALAFAKIRQDGIANIYFGWIGSLEESKKHYFVLNGPGFLIEFDNSGFGSANHIHAIWREKGNDFGEDILKKHYKSSRH